MPGPLENPSWVAPESCVRCGYNLTGLAAPGRCPECGEPFGARQLILFGVPRSAAGTSPMRRFIWVMLMLGAVVYTYGWPLLITGLGFIVALAGFGVFVVAVIAMIATSKRERSGTERLIISSSGIARLPRSGPVQSVTDLAFIPWNGATGVELKRISGRWYRLRIGTVYLGGIRDAIFEAGIRCPDAQAPEVRQAIEEMLHTGTESRFTSA